MPHINRPSLKHQTNFRTKDGDQWLAFTDEAQIQQMIDAFMVINSKVIWDKKILKSCNRAFSQLPGRRDFATIWRDPDIYVSFNPNPDPGLSGDHVQKGCRDRGGAVQESQCPTPDRGDACPRAGPCQRRPRRDGEQDRGGDAAALRLRRPVQSGDGWDGPTPAKDRDGVMRGTCAAPSSAPALTHARTVGSLSAHDRPVVVALAVVHGLRVCIPEPDTSLRHDVLLTR